MLNYITTSLLLFIGVYVSICTGAGFELPEGFTTPKDFDIYYTRTAFTVAEKEITTDIPQAFIDEALNLDVGKFSTMSFHYFNHQNNYNVHDRPLKRCFDDHLKCIVTQIQQAPVCAVSDTRSSNRYLTMTSYCHVYLDNCRRGARYWVIHRLGPCQWFDIHDECKDFAYESCR